MPTFENNEALYRMTSSVGQRRGSGCLSHRFPTEAEDAVQPAPGRVAVPTATRRQSTERPAQLRLRTAVKASICTRCCNYWVQKTTSRKTNSVERRFQRMHIPATLSLRRRKTEKKPALDKLLVSRTGHKYRLKDLYLIDVSMQRVLAEGNRILLTFPVSASRSYSPGGVLPLCN